jgi:uncharacterized protein (DUF2126 family)
VPVRCIQWPTANVLYETTVSVQPEISMADLKAAAIAAASKAGAIPLDSQAEVTAVWVPKRDAKLSFWLPPTTATAKVLDATDHIQVRRQAT